MFFVDLAGFALGGGEQRDELLSGGFALMVAAFLGLLAVMAHWFARKGAPPSTATSLFLRLGAVFLLSGSFVSALLGDGLGWLMTYGLGSAIWIATFTPAAASRPPEE